MVIVSFIFIASVIIPKQFRTSLECSWNLLWVLLSHKQLSQLSKEKAKGSCWNDYASTFSMEKQRKSSQQAENGGCSSVSLHKHCPLSFSYSHRRRGRMAPHCASPAGWHSLSFSFPFQRGEKNLMGSLGWGDSLHLCHSSSLSNIPASLVTPSVTSLLSGRFSG